jgi:hypothetical protein
VKNELNWDRIERTSHFLVRKVLWPILELIVALGSSVIVSGKLLMHVAAAESRMATCNNFSPTGMQSGNTPQAALTVKYNRNFVENLKATLVMMRMTTRIPMEVNAGQVFRQFMIEPLDANTTQTTEGTVGSSLTVDINYQDYQLGQWADFLNISDKSFITSISDDLLNYEKEMAYRAAFSIDDLIMAYFDYLRTSDPKTANQDVLTGNFQLTKQQIEQVPFSLLGQNVKPMDGGYFCGKIHPFFVADLLALDNSNNSIVDIAKHTPEGMMKLSELPNGEDGDEVNVIDMFGCKWMMSTNCTQTTGTQSPVANASGQTAVRTYLAGKDAIVSVKLDRPDRTEVGEGRWQNMKLWRGEYKMGNQADPAGIVGAGTSYNFIMAFGPPPDPTSRARCFDAVPQTT